MEARFSSASFAYRPNLSYLNAVEKIADFRDEGYVWVFDADIAKFFDNIYHGHLASEESTNIDNHLIQMQRRDDDYFQFQVSKAIVYGKLTNSKQLLMRFNRKRKIAAIEQAIYGISKDIDSLELVDDLDSLRGYEGITAARYFPAFGQLITNPNNDEFHDLALFVIIYLYCQ